MPTTRSHVLRTGRVDSCLSSPCHNGGRCTSYGRYYICRCSSGFHGPRCDVAADLTTFRWSPTTPTPGATTAVVTPNVPLSAAVTSVVVVVILTSIFVVCCLKTAKKRRKLQLAYPSVPRYTPGIRIIRPSNHRGVERENPQINTRGNSFIPQSDVTCNHGGVEIRVDGGSVNYGYDPATDSPPPYVSVVADPKLVIHQDNSQEPPPSYEEVLAATRPPSAPSDAHVTSPDSMTSQKENTSQEPNTTLA